MVQGVSYRYYTAMTAQSLGINGWVRNLPSGEVEALFEGQRSEVEKMIDWCRSGPSAARVDEVLVDWQDSQNEFSDFSIR
jgi:acylphosphatase